MQTTHQKMAWNRVRLLGLLMLGGLLAAGAVLAGAVFAGGAGEAGSGDAVLDDGVFRIVATTTQASDLARVLSASAPATEVVALMGAGVDPHLYQPTEADIRAISSADLLLYSGLNLEGQFDAVFASLAARGIPTYALSDPVNRAGFVIGAAQEDGGTPGSDDPHFWFDPRNWEITVEGLARALEALDPANADVYRVNAESYVQQLRLLYSWADRGMRSVPAPQRYLVTSHDAFQYFGAAFGWRMAAIQGISTEDEAGVGDIQQTVDFVIANSIPVLFVESSIPPDTIRAVQEAIAAEGAEVRLGVRELFGDAMGEPGTFGGTYIGMIAQNVLTVLQSYRLAGLDITIPPWPSGLEPVPPAELLRVN